MEELTLEQTLFCDIFWLVAFFIFLPSIKSKTTKGSFLFLWSFIAIYSTFEFTGGDFYHYMAIYKTNLLASYERSHLEGFYYWLIHLLPSNFYIWRFAVWGLAGLFWILTLKNLKQEAYFGGLMFLLIVFFLFVGARQALCFSVLYYALSILSKDKISKFNKLISFLSLIVCSYFLHKTAIVYILIILISLFPFGKKSLILSLILFPILYRFFDVLTQFFISEYSVFNDESTTSMENYMEGEVYVRNLYGQIHLFIDRFPIFLLITYSLWKVFVKNDIIPTIYKILLRTAYIMVYISYLFAGRDISGFISPRFWDAALFPLTLFITGYMYNRRQSHFFKICFYLLIFSKFYKFAYGLYKI